MVRRQHRQKPQQRRRRHRRPRQKLGHLHRAARAEDEACDSGVELLPIQRRTLRHQLHRRTRSMHHRRRSHLKSPRMRI
jgi:hypothetical protein